MKSLLKKQTTSLEKKVNTYIQTLDRECDNFIETKEKPRAKALAQSNQPYHDEDCTPYLEPIESYFKTVITKTNLFLQELQGDIIISEHTIPESQSEDELKNLVIAKRNEYDSKVINRDTTDYKIYQTLMMILIIIESIWISSVMTSFSDVNIIAIIGAFLLSFCLLTLVEKSTLHWRDNAIPLHQKVLIIFLLLAFTIVLGLFRYSQVIIHTAENGTVIVGYINNPIIYIFLSLLPIAATIFIVHSYFLSKSEIKVMKEKKRIKKEIVKLEKQIKELNNASHSRSQTNHYNDNNSAKLDQYKTQLNDHIQALKQRAISAFISENTLLRTDGKRPQLKKALITPLLIPIAIFTVFSLSGCQKNNTSTSITLMTDITDTFHYHPNIHKILESQHDKLRSQGCTVTVQTISDLHVNPKETFELPSTSYLFSSDIKRKKQIAQFENSIDSSLTSLASDNTEKSVSQIIEPIIQCLNEIKTSNGMKNEIYIYSDLLINTNTFSCYKKKDMELLKLHPKMAQDLLFRSLTIRDLSSVTVYLNYSAKNRYEEDCWYNVAKCLKSYLEQYHATVVIGAST